MTARPAQLVGMFIDNFAKFESHVDAGRARRGAAPAGSCGIVAASSPTHGSKGPASRRAFSFSAPSRHVCAHEPTTTIIIADEAVIHPGRPGRRISSARPAPAARTSTRWRPPCSCASTPRNAPGLSERVRDADDQACRPARHQGRRHRHRGRPLPHAGAEPRRRPRRLTALVAKAAEPPPPPRKKTRPSKGSVERRLKTRPGARR